MSSYFKYLYIFLLYYFLASLFAFTPITCVNRLITTFELISPFIMYELYSNMGRKYCLFLVGLIISVLLIDINIMYSTIVASAGLGLKQHHGDNDFLKYTLEQSKKGYSVHYATAAALMLRYFGVPARYVEGYFISAEEASKYSSMETVELTEAHAHAWTEYYLDGIGWIPFEVTPGYIDEEELAAAEQVISDGIGEGSGKSYGSSKLTYKPPKQQEDEQKAPDRNSLFRFEIKDIINSEVVR